MLGSNLAMRPRTPLLVLAMTVALTSLGISSCHGLPTGPSASAVVLSNLTLQSTTGNAALCCCRIAGTARNDNRIPVHATIKFSAFDASSSDAISTILFFIEDMDPGVTRPIDAPGFIFPCNAIKRLQTQVDVKGLAFPGQ